MGVLKQIWLYEIYGSILLIYQNTPMRVNGAWIKIYCVLCWETYNILHSCDNLPAGSRQAARGARICETGLLHGCSSHIATRTRPPSHQRYLDRIKKSDPNLKCAGLKYTLLITTKFYSRMCKISLWSFEHVLNYSTPNFYLIWNSIEIPWVGRGPGFSFYKT